MLKRIDISDIKPNGWLRKYLDTQIDGLTGHIESAGFPFNTSGWASEEHVPSIEGERWWPYEQIGYWVDGALRCAILTDNKPLLEKVKKQIDYVLDNPDEDGFLGPKFLKDPKGWHRWPLAVVFRAFMALYSYNKDTKIIDSLVKHYLNGGGPHSDGRNICNVEIMLWLYDITGNKALLDIAIKDYDEFNALNADDDTTLNNMASDKRATIHGVTFCEQSKLAAILYLYTKDKKYLEPVVNAYKKLDKYSMLVDGVCSSTERLKGNDALASHETCDIADLSWSLSYLIMATGNTEYADKLEKACFNAAPGAVKNDFKALQYFSCPNQVVCDIHSNHNEFHKGKAWMSYRPNPGTECCPGDVNRIMPNYVLNMWMRDEENNIYAVLYGASVLKTKVNDSNITIEQITKYPFSDIIDFKFTLDKPIELAFNMRIPAWCESAEIYVNGNKIDEKISSSEFYNLKRTFADGDIITLKLPSKFRISNWPGDGIAIEKGPLVYSLKIDEDWQVDTEDKKSTKDFPAYNLYPKSKWNYAPILNKNNLEESIIVNENENWDYPWDLKNPPHTLTVKAREVKNWMIEEWDYVIPKERGARVDGDIKLTPPIPHRSTIMARLGKIENITLVPYGCTHLRITIFPDINK
ncbi:MAG: beta-L-arabinofuranosidase domain-containing protein [Armatimonadota bacterium]